MIRNAIKIIPDSRQRNKITKWFTLNDLSYFFDSKESEVILSYYLDLLSFENSYMKFGIF